MDTKKNSKLKKVVTVVCCGGCGYYCYGVKQGKYYFKMTL